MNSTIVLMVSSAFIGQCPLLLLSILLVWWKLEEPQQNIDLKQSIWTKLKRIDFVGAFFMSIAILACITAFDLGSKKHSTSVIIILVAIGFTAGILFILTEKLWAKEPIFPLELLGKDAVITSYTIIFIQTGIQVAVSAQKAQLRYYVIISVVSSCSLYRYTSRSLQMQAWVRPVHILFLPFLAILSAVLLSVLGSSGQLSILSRFLSSQLTSTQYWPLQTSNHPR